MTEKNYNTEQKLAKTMKKQENIKQKVDVAPVKEEIKQEAKEVKTEKKTGKKKAEPVKRDYASVNGISLPISTKDSVVICKFIRYKPIDKAISDLEEVSIFRKAIPMKAGIPHRKGNIMAGRYMTKPVGFFIRLLKDLKANSNVNGLDNPIITEAMPNRASRPYGRFGAVQRKRTHVKITVTDKSKIKRKEKKK